MSDAIKKIPALKVFYSYSHVDEAYRDSLGTHLSPLRRKDIITDWHDRKIVPGQVGDTEIDSKLAESDLILLLISPDFIDSDYCFGIEMERAMEQHESNKSVVVPIIIRPTDITDEPFAKLQTLPTDMVPVAIWSNQDEALLDVVHGLKNAIELRQESIQRLSKSDSSLKDIRTILMEEIERVDAAFQSDDEVCSGIATGFDKLDIILDGIHGCDFWVIASRPQMGKTDFILNVLCNIAIDEKIPVALFSTQLPKNKIIRRMISYLGRIDHYHQLKGLLTDEDWPRLTSVVHMLAESKIFINDKSQITISELSDSVRSLQKQHGVGVLVLDDLQNVILSDSNTKSEPEDISKAIKNLARDLNLPIISTLPISRELEKRVDKRPLITDLGVWDSLQNDADIVLFIYRDELYDESSYDKGIAEIIVARNNNGHIGMIRLVYLDKYYTFADYIPEMYDLSSADEGELTN